MLVFLKKSTKCKVYIFVNREGKCIEIDSCILYPNQFLYWIESLLCTAMLICSIHAQLDTGLYCTVLFNLMMQKVLGSQRPTATGKRGKTNRTCIEGTKQHTTYHHSREHQPKHRKRVPQTKQQSGKKHEKGHKGTIILQSTPFKTTRSPVYKAR